MHGSVHPDFLVKDSLPNVSFPLPRNFAGNIGVNRVDHPNDTLFFWAFESQNGSLTAAADECSDRPWAIWLNGGYVFILVILGLHMHLLIISSISSVENEYTNESELSSA